MEKQDRDERSLQGPTHYDNDYHIDHITKEKLEQNGNLPDVMDVVDDA